MTSLFIRIGGPVDGYAEALTTIEAALAKYGGEVTKRDVLAGVCTVSMDGAYEEAIAPLQRGDPAPIAAAYPGAIPGKDMLRWSSGARDYGKAWNAGPNVRGDGAFGGMEEEEIDGLLLTLGERTHQELL